MSQKSRFFPSCHSAALSWLGSVFRAVPLWWQGGCYRSHHPLLTEVEREDGLFLPFCLVSLLRVQNFPRSPFPCRLHYQKCLTHPFLNGHHWDSPPRGVGRAWSMSPLDGWPFGAPLGRRGVMGMTVGDHWEISHVHSLWLMVRPLYWRCPVALRKADKV